MQPYCDRLHTNKITLLADASMHENLSLNATRSTCIVLKESSRFNCVFHFQLFPSFFEKRHNVMHFPLKQDYSTRKKMWDETNQLSKLAIPYQNGDRPNTPPIWLLVNIIQWCQRQRHVLIKDYKGKLLFRWISNNKTRNMQGIVTLRHQTYNTIHRELKKKMTITYKAIEQHFSGL